jgi:predicted dehydrogenase
MTIPPRCWPPRALTVAQAAMVPCISHLLADVRGERAAETTAWDNLRTLELVEACYTSAGGGGAMAL